MAKKKYYILFILYIEKIENVAGYFTCAMFQKKNTKTVEVPHLIKFIIESHFVNDKINHTDVNKKKKKIDKIY